MKRVAVVMLLVTFVSSSAFAGTITFTPDKATVLAGEKVKFDLTLSSLDVLSAFDSIDVVVGAPDGLVIQDFVFSAESIAGSIFQAVTPDVGKYIDDTKFGFFGLAPLGTPFNLGSLTVDTTGLEIGKYTLVVSFDTDLQSTATLSGLSEPLFGSASVNVIPEPATISLLGLATLALIRRRKTIA